MADSPQLSLPLDFAPDSVRAHGLRAAHPRPLVSHGKRVGEAFTSFRVSPAEAWRYPELEYGNAGSSVAALVLDCDDPRSMGLGLPHLQPPNWTVTRPENHHAHLAWCLDKPVHRYPSARIEPLRYFASIAEYYAYATNADPSYAGVLAHNPAPQFKDEYKTTWGAERAYSLDQLATVIPLGWQAPVVRQTGVGRNVDLFEAGCRWAGRAANRGVDVFAALVAVNQQFDNPLPLSEVRATAKSIERYRERWKARGWHCPRWIARQAARSRKQSGKAQKRSASPKGSNEALRPWEAEGVCRALWYRNRKAERENDATKFDADKALSLSA